MHTWTDKCACGRRILAPAVLVAWSVLIIAPAFADEPAKSPEQKTRQPVVLTSKEHPPATTQPASDEKPLPATARGGKSRTRQPRQATPPRNRARGRSHLPPDPNAKFVCENTSVTLDPVWRGEQSLTFDFFIRNEGTADLRIRAKGG